MKMAAERFPTKFYNWELNIYSHFGLSTGPCTPFILNWRQYVIIYKPLGTTYRIMPAQELPLLQVSYSLDIQAD